MPILMLVAAGLIAAPQSDAGLRQTVLNNYPVKAIREAKSGAVRMQVWIDPAGKVYRCEVVQLVGDEVFRTNACKPFAGQVVQHAVALDGSASYGMIAPFMRYVTRGRMEREVRALPDPADITLDRTGAAAAAHDFKIVVQVEGDGRVSHCEGLEDAPVGFVERACARATESTQPIGTDEAGTPVRYVSELLVRVDAQPSTS